MQKRSRQTTPEDPQAPTRPDTEGTHVWWLINEGEVGSRRGVLAVTEIPPDKRHVLHRHPNCEQVTYVLSGSGLHLTTGEPVRQGAGEAVHIRPGEWHGFENDCGETVTLFMLYGGAGSKEEAGYELYEGDDGPAVADRVNKVSLDGVAEDASLDESRGFSGLGVSWLVTSGTVGAEHVTLGVSRFEPGGTHGLHRHPGADEVLFITGGGGTHLADGEEVPLRAGEVAFIPAGELHGFRNDSDTTTTVFGYFGASALEQAGYEEPTSASGGPGGEG